MAKRVITFSLDVEASGPIPGPWWMCSLGLCQTGDVQRGLRLVLKPLVIPGVSEADDPAAMQVVAQGLPENLWTAEDTVSANVARVRGWFETHGKEPRAAMEELQAWLAAECGEDRPVLVGSPVTFDFMWLYWYWWRLMASMPPFGFSGLDVRSYFMGSHGVDFLGTGKQRYLKHYPNEFAHTHDPLDDARQQGRIWADMVEARNSRKKSE